VSVKIKVEIYSNFKFLFVGIVTLIATIAEALYAEKELNEVKPRWRKKSEMS
jgi:hypothetical protein